MAAVVVVLSGTACAGGRGRQLRTTRTAIGQRAVCAQLPLTPVPHVVAAAAAATCMLPRSSTTAAIARGASQDHFVISNITMPIEEDGSHSTSTIIKHFTDGGVNPEGCMAALSG